MTDRAARRRGLMSTGRWRGHPRSQAGASRDAMAIARAPLCKSRKAWARMAAGRHVEGVAFALRVERPIGLRLGGPTGPQLLYDGSGDRCSCRPASLSGARPDAGSTGAGGGAAQGPGADPGLRHPSRRRSSASGMPQGHFSVAPPPRSTARPGSRFRPCVRGAARPAAPAGRQERVGPERPDKSANMPRSRQEP